MSKKTATEERTYTLDELVGETPRWLHRCGVGRPTLCGSEPTLSRPRPYSPAPGKRYCPDCQRIAKALGWRV